VGRFIAAVLVGFIALALFVAALVMGVVALDRGLSRWLHDPALAAAFAMATLIVLGLIAVVVAYACLRRPRRRPTAPLSDSTASEFGQAASDLARRNPWLGVGAAFAAGFLASNSKTTEQLLAELLRQARNE
jgi:Na+/melibiose symporter-like transporter